jgi:hypothetical protein
MPEHVLAKLAFRGCQGASLMGLAPTPDFQLEYDLVSSLTSHDHTQGRAELETCGTPTVRAKSIGA